MPHLQMVWSYFLSGAPPGPPGSPPPGPPPARNLAAAESGKDETSMLSVTLTKQIWSILLQSPVGSPWRRDGGLPASGRRGQWASSPLMCSLLKQPCVHLPCWNSSVEKAAMSRVLCVLWDWLLESIQLSLRRQQLWMSGVHCSSLGPSRWCWSERRSRRWQGELRRRSFATSAKETQKSSENDEQVSLQPCDYVTTILIISCFAQNTEKA